MLVGFHIRHGSDQVFEVASEIKSVGPLVSTALNDGERLVVSRVDP